MNQHEEIRVAKRNCKIFYYLKNPYRRNSKNGVVVKLPATSKYKGYQFYAEDFSYLPQCIIIRKPKSKKQFFTLEKSNGGSPRLKLSFEEIQAEFKEHSAQFQEDEFAQVLAYVEPCYETGQFDMGYLCIGWCDEKYFYDIDFDWSGRYKLNTPAVQILKTLTAEEVATVKEKAQRFNFLRNFSAYDFACLYLNFEYSEKCMKQDFPDVHDAISKKLREIKKILRKNRADCNREIEELEEYFNVSELSDPRQDWAASNVPSIEESFLLCPGCGTFVHIEDWNVGSQRCNQCTEDNIELKTVKN